MDLPGIPQLSQETWSFACAALAALLFAQLLWSWLRRALRRARIRARARRAGEGEQLAARWLTDLGYEILGAQVAIDHAVAVDDELMVVELRADFLVEQGGRRFVVEVKTGQFAPRLSTAATRRQLLEYRVAFDVDGVLLLDAEAGRLSTVTFPRLAS